jgi:outer membrane protein assembly factor BamB
MICLFPSEAAGISWPTILSVRVEQPRGMKRLALAFAFIIALLLAVSAEAAASTAALIASPEPGWPQFRGPRRDGICDESGLLQSWPEAGPRVLWSAKGLGRGFSSPIIADGRLFITGDFDAELHVLAFDLTGKLLWRAKNGDAWLNQYRGARSSVSYSEGRIFHENAHGRVACFDAANGKEIWAVNLLERFGGENITWGLSECLLVDEHAVYATAGGRDALLVALDKQTGELRWKSEPLLDTAGDNSVDNAGYVSPILVQFAGRRLIIGASSRHMFCADAATGALQWTRRRKTPYAVIAMMPVLVGDAVFLSAPLGPPGQLHRLIAPTKPGETVGVEDAWTTPLDTCQGGVVHVNGRLFGSYYPARKGWAALDATSGKVLYDEPQFAKGAALYADGRLYALCEDGWMRLLEPTDTKFEVRGQFRLVAARDKDAWAHPVVHGGKLYLRYHDALYCYDVRATR